MPCYHPLIGWRSRSVNPATGKRSIVFNSREGYPELEVTVPCGQCVGCRLDRSRQWAIRCVHEASLYCNNCFITLTYRPESLPSNGSLCVKHFQDFMKRLRSRFPVTIFTRVFDSSDFSLVPVNYSIFPLQLGSIRYFHCGEYGSLGLRPHYHACLFNFDFPDRVLYKSLNVSGLARSVDLFQSSILSEIWGHGFCTVGDVTFESAAYVARYITKKISGDPRFQHYEAVTDLETGKVSFGRQPEYITMSRRPGVGTGWFQKFASDVFPADRVVLMRDKGPVECKPPKFYSSLYEKALPTVYDSVFDVAVCPDYRKLKFSRILKASAHAEDCTPERLCEREYIHVRKLQLLKRGFENVS